MVDKVTNFIAHTCVLMTMLFVQLLMEWKSNRIKSNENLSLKSPKHFGKVSQVQQVCLVSARCCYRIVVTERKGYSSPGAHSSLV